MGVGGIMNMITTRVKTSGGGGYMITTRVKAGKHAEGGIFVI